jgi:hypothetical protein
MKLDYMTNENELHYENFTQLKWTLSMFCSMMGSVVVCHAAGVQAGGAESRRRMPL